MSEPAPRVHFGGPDLPPRLLRDMLQQRVQAVPAGGEIAWATYYFRDRALAAALMDASDRGVRVALRLEGAPRFERVNNNVIAMLQDHGLGGGLRVHRPGWNPLKTRYPYWHSKIYCFSHPRPAVIIGSFNPSGDEPEDPAILTDIGDQDRGHNLLVEFFGKAAFHAMARRVRSMSQAAARYRPLRNLPVRLGQSKIWLYPRHRPGLIDRQLMAIGPGDRVRGAISHLKRGMLADGLAAAARRGADIDLLVHDTERRVREEALTLIAESGVRARRYAHPEALPLHVKFLIVETARGSEAWFGSFNFNKRSYWHNHEVLVRSGDPAIVVALEQRFRAITAEVDQLQSNVEQPPRIC